MSDQDPSAEWIEAANSLATVAHQLSSAMHEANNLLQVIAGSAEMIQFKAGLPDDVLKRTEVIAEHAHRVSSLLGTARELTKFPPRTEGQTIDLRGVIYQAIELRKHALGRAQICLSSSLGDEPLVVRANARPTLQIVLNLMLNAEQAIGSRRDGRIDLRLSRDAAGASLVVQDNGSGYGADAARAFTLQVQGETSPRLGLGLLAARWMAEREGGTLDLSGSPAGTLATLRLPVL